jgi:hypothetical protein
MIFLFSDKKTLIGLIYTTLRVNQREYTQRPRDIGVFDMGTARTQIFAQ